MPASAPQDRLRPVHRLGQGLARVGRGRVAEAPGETDQRRTRVGRGDRVADGEVQAGGGLQRTRGDAVGPEVELRDRPAPAGGRVEERGALLEQST